jgi:hypothetical protein
MSLFAIDPGTVQSAWLILVSGVPIGFGIEPNAALLDRLRHGVVVSEVVIEQVESMGMSVGAEVFETVYWSGQFAEAAQPLPVRRITRRQVKLHLCGTMKAKDPNIRQALIDRFGGKDAAIGTKPKPGPLYGVHADIWAALAVAVTAMDLDA